jgi:hypothetical protein
LKKVIAMRARLEGREREREREEEEMHVTVLQR